MRRTSDLRYELQVAIHVAPEFDHVGPGVGQEHLLLVLATDTGALPLYSCKLLMFLCCPECHSHGHLPFL